MTDNIIRLWARFDPDLLRERVIASGKDVSVWDAQFLEGIDRGWHRQDDNGAWWFIVARYCRNAS